MLLGFATTQPQKSKKEKRKDKSKEKEESDSDAEPAPAPAAPPARGRPQGRYAKREAGKLVKGYSQTDLSMILGMVPDPFASAPPAFTRPRSDDLVVGEPAGASDEADGAASDGDERRARKERRRDKKRKAEAAAAVPEAIEEDVDRDPHAGAPPPEGWWGGGVFVWAGRLGGIMRQADKQRGFNEDDQVKLYSDTHDGATSGRQGLGIRSLPPKVAGARWKGKKVQFGDDDDEAEEEAQEAADRDLSRLKWKKHAERCLRATPGGEARMKALLRDVLAAAGVAGANEAEALGALSRCVRCVWRVTAQPLTLRPHAGDCKAAADSWSRATL